MIQYDQKGGNTIFITVDHPGETPGTGCKPAYDITISGNFQDIDERVFKNSDYAPDEVVGRWYEEGYTNGYCLEMYGDGTWQYFGEETRTGLYEIMNSSLTLIDGFYGVDIASVMPYDADGKTLSLWTYALLPTRTRAEQVRFYPEEASTYLEDIEAYYDARYPNRYLTGFWFPVGDYLGDHYYVMEPSFLWVPICFSMMITDTSCTNSIRTSIISSKAYVLIFPTILSHGFFTNLP